MRALFPALRASTYLNTAAVGLASTRLAAVLTETIATWTEAGFDWERGEAAAAASRTAVARLIGASPRDVALVPPVSAAAGLVAAQSCPLPPAEETAARLKAHGVVAAVRGEFIRFAVHFYNDEEDVERAVRALVPRRGPSTPLD